MLEYDEPKVPPLHGPVTGVEYKNIDEGTASQLEVCGNYGMRRIKYWR